MYRPIPNIFVFLLVIFTYSQSNAESPETFNWEKDIDFIGEILPEKHPNLFFKTPADTFNKELEILKTQVGQLSRTEIIFKIQKILARMGDDHTTVDFIPASMRNGV